MAVGDYEYLASVLRTTVALGQDAIGATAQDIVGNSTSTAMVLRSLLITKSTPEEPISFPTHIGVVHTKEIIFYF